MLCDNDVISDNFGDYGGTVRRVEHWYEVVRLYENGIGTMDKVSEEQWDVTHLPLKGAGIKKVKWEYSCTEGPNGIINYICVPNPLPLVALSFTGQWRHNLAIGAIYWPRGRGTGQYNNNNNSDNDNNIHR